MLRLCECTAAQPFCLDRNVCTHTHIYKAVISGVSRVFIFFYFLMWQAWPFWSLTVYTAEASLLNCLPTSVCERPTNCCRDNRAKKTGAVRVCVCDFKVEGVDDDDDEERRQVIDVFFVWIFFVLSEQKEKREKVHCTIIITLSLMSFEFYFIFSSRMYHYDTQPNTHSVQAKYTVRLDPVAR
jgi:hypothetical protein